MSEVLPIQLILELDVLGGEISAFEQRLLHGFLGLSFILSPLLFFKAIGTVALHKIVILNNIYIILPFGASFAVRCS